MGFDLSTLAPALGGALRGYTAGLSGGEQAKLNILRQNWQQNFQQQQFDAQQKYQQQMLDLRHQSLLAALKKAAGKTGRDPYAEADARVSETVLSNIFSKPDLASDYSLRGDALGQTVAYHMNKLHPGANVTPAMALHLVAGQLGIDDTQHGTPATVAPPIVPANAPPPNLAGILSANPDAVKPDMMSTGFPPSTPEGYPALGTAGDFIPDNFPMPHPAIPLAPTPRLDAGRLSLLNAGVAPAVQGNGAAAPSLVPPPAPTPNLTPYIPPSADTQSQIDLRFAQRGEAWARTREADANTHFTQTKDANLPYNDWAERQVKMGQAVLASGQAGLLGPNFNLKRYTAIEDVRIRDTANGIQRFLATVTRDQANTAAINVNGENFLREAQAGKIAAEVQNMVTVMTPADKEAFSKLQLYVPTPAGGLVPMEQNIQAAESILSKYGNDYTGLFPRVLNSPMGKGRVNTTNGIQSKDSVPAYVPPAGIGAGTGLNTAPRLPGVNPNIPQSGYPRSGAPTDDPKLNALLDQKDKIMKRGKYAPKKGK